MTLYTPSLGTVEEVESACGCPKPERSMKPDLPAIDNDEAWAWIAYAKHLKESAPCLCGSNEHGEMECLEKEGEG